jgi:hypothetical protein
LPKGRPGFVNYLTESISLGSSIEKNIHF